MQDALAASLRLALGAAAACAAVPVQAFDLGEATVRSALGEPLDVRVALFLAPGESPERLCFEIGSPGATALPAVRQAVVSIEGTGPARNIRVRTATPASEPAMALRLRGGCPGIGATSTRDFVLLLEPRTGSGAARPEIGATVISRGQTLESVAEIMHPADRAVRERYLEALRLANPGFPVGRQVPEGASIALPDLRWVATRTPVAVAPSAPDRSTQPPIAFVPGAGFGLRLALMADTAGGQRRGRSASGPPEANGAALELRPSSGIANPPTAQRQPVAAPEAAAAATQATPASRPPSATPAGAWTPPRWAHDDIAPWVAAIGGLLLVLLSAWGLRAWRRRADRNNDAEATGSFADTVIVDSPDEAGMAEEPIEVAVDPRPAIASDASLATRLTDDHTELRRRYIGERFPEVERGAIMLDDPASVVKGARLFHEDGAVSRAIELLQFAIEDSPGQVKPWLALFEILRLERRAPQFAGLAARFRDRHGEGGPWTKIMSAGREIDPQNPVFRAAPEDTLQTIGPREAGRMAGFDPVADNWLDAPMDFENEVLANDLRSALMAGSRVAERDLEPDPMPALRRVEVLSVA